MLSLGGFELEGVGGTTNKKKMLFINDWVNILLRKKKDEVNK